MLACASILTRYCSGGVPGLGSASLSELRSCATASSEAGTAALGRTGVGTSSVGTLVGILVPIFELDVILARDGSQREEKH